MTSVTRFKKKMRIDVVEVIDEFLAKHKLQKGFHNRANGILLDVIALRLEWCNMKTLPKKTMASRE